MKNAGRREPLSGVEAGPAARTVLKIRLIDCATELKPAIVWLHFIGAVEAEFLELAQLPMNGNGAGLNSLVAEALHPQSSVSRVLFTSHRLKRQSNFSF
jgi:hypothetical protein